MCSFLPQSCRLVSGFVVSLPLDPLRITGNSDALHNFICLNTLTLAMWLGLLQMLQIAVINLNLKLERDFYFK